ncbi:MAG: FliH/SctL family protein [Thermodesulfobacteriota bacterium]|nr:FliH/SctL family protein [Thermodesulfobacteriota bacterium]
MMNLSSVIKLHGDGSSLDGLESSLPNLEDSGEFVSYESLWHDREGDEEEIGSSPVEKLMKEQERILSENEEMIEKARAEAEEIEKQAYDKGFARGEEEGMTSGRAKFDDRLLQAANLIRELEKARSDIHRRYEDDLLPLIKTMVDRLVNYEVSVNSQVIMACLRDAMEFVVARSTVKVHLHPVDLERINKMEQDDPEILSGRQQVELVADPDISEGGCFLETEFGEIDATIENRREQLYEAVDQAFQAAIEE